MKVLKKETEKLLKIIKFILNFLIKKQHIFYMSIPLIAMDLLTRIYGYNIDFYNITGISPNLFTLTWIILFIGLTLGTKKKFGKHLYLFINILFLFLFLVNNIYYSMTSTFFDFTLLESASEGSSYILETIKNANILIYISAIFIIYLIYTGVKKIPYTTKNNPKMLLFIFEIVFAKEQLHEQQDNKNYRGRTGYSACLL